MTVSPSGNLFMRDVIISGTPNSRPGLRINGGSAWIEQSKIVNNTGGGIVVEGGGTLMLENSFVGGLASDVPTVIVNDGSFNIVYSTIGATAVGTTALECADGTGSSIRNSIVVFSNGVDPNGGELLCPNIDLGNNALEGNFGGSNVSLGDMSTGWFTNLNGGFNSGEFFLSGSHPDEINTAARWQAGDPATDIDGDPRPTTDGSEDYAGADRP